MICQKNFLKILQLLQLLCISAAQPKVKDQVQELRSKYDFTIYHILPSHLHARALPDQRKSPEKITSPSSRLSWAIKQQFAQWVFVFVFMILVVAFLDLLNTPKMTGNICC